MRINNAINKLKDNIPIYYDSTSTLTYENGINMSRTWADYIRIDFEHGPFDIAGLKSFMSGLIDGGPSIFDYRTPTVIAEIPVDGISENAIRYNSWMIKQVLAQGVHGIILCHAESPKAVKTFVEYTRYPFNKIGIGNQLDLGRRGHGGAKFASNVWGISVENYLNVCDVWPLNPNGQLLLGIKVENTRALEFAEQSISTPGIAFAEWGEGDMCFSLGFSESYEWPFPEKIQNIMNQVWKMCLRNKKYFLTVALENNIKYLIDNNARIFRARDPKVAEKGRNYFEKK